MKKITTILITALTLTGCFGGTESQAVEAPIGFKAFETNEISLIYPEAWELLTQSDFTSSVPANTIAAIRNNIRSDIFTANLNITKSSLQKGTTVEDFKKSNIEALKNSLIGFQELETVEHSEGLLLSFQGKKGISEPVLNFKQLLSTGDTSAYIVTASYLPGEDESIVKALNEMLESVSLK